jgi:serine/threonine protein kinase
MLALGTVPNRDDSDPDGSGASFVVMPLCERRLPTIGQLSTAERLSIVERLFFALSELYRQDPRFVHGAIRQASVGLCLTDRCGGAARLLPGAAAGRAAAAAGYRATAAGSMPYLAPECYGGAPVSHRSDVFAVGVLAYEMLGGDLQLLTQALRSRRGVPRLPPQQGVPPHIENAILAALQGDPSQRPVCRVTVAAVRRQSEGTVVPASVVQTASLVLPPSG